MLDGKCAVQPSDQVCQKKKNSNQITDHYLSMTYSSISLPLSATSCDFFLTRSINKNAEMVHQITDVTMRFTSTKDFIFKR